MAFAPRRSPTFRSTIHTAEYYATVNRLLLSARTRQEAIAALTAIRRALLGGGHPQGHVPKKSQMRDPSLRW